MIRIFVSYSHQDSKFADRLVKDLDNLGVSTFYAKLKIKVGDSIVEKINIGLSSHDILLVILSNSSVNSDWVKKELNSSLMRQLSQQSIRVFPVLLEHCNIPTLLADIKYADFTSEYQKGLKELFYALEEDIDLERYVEIVEKSCPKVVSEKREKEVAMMLRKIDPISFFRHNVYSVIEKSGGISKNELLDHFTGIDTVESELQILVDDGLVVQKDIDNSSCFTLTSIGEEIFYCLSYGFNEGVLGPVCSH
jgi:TIR domain-containing protein